jgi:nucleoside-diphosphate-sugar epimerase
MKILITGIHGFVGSNFANSFSNGNELFGLARIIHKVDFDLKYF